MPARYGTLLEPVTHPVHTDLQNRLAEMGATHRCLMRDRTATLNRLKNPHDQSAAAPRRHRLLQIEAQITSLDAPTDALVTEDAHLSQRWDVLASIPELGTVTAQALFCESAKELDLSRMGGSMQGSPHPAKPALLLTGKGKALTWLFVVACDNGFSVSLNYMRVQSSPRKG